jgi:protein KRI1
VDGYIIQSNRLDKTENGEVDSKKRLMSTLKSSDVETDQSSNTQKARKKKKKKKKKMRSEEIKEFSCRAPAETQSVPLLFKKHNHKVSGKKFQKACRQSDESEKQDNLALSDARLRAYGINPKRFKNKLKYGIKNKFKYGNK